MLILALIRLALICLVLLFVLIGSIMGFLHVIRQQSDTFLVANKLSKGVWIGILIACALVSLFLLRFVDISSSFSTNTLFVGAIAGTAVMTYWVDVRPTINRFQKK